MPLQLFFVRFVLLTSLLCSTAATLVLPPLQRSPVRKQLLERRPRPGLVRQEAHALLHQATPQAPFRKEAFMRPVVSGAKDTAVLEVARLDIFGFPFYVTYVAFGNPPQPFALLLDLSYGGAVVRSVDCPDHGSFNDCGGRPFKYNHSASSTSHDPELRFGVRLAGHTARGSMFNDTMHIVSLQMQNATVGAIDVFYGENLGYSILSEALGLGRPNRTSLSYFGGYEGDIKSHPNFLYELVASGTLARNVMTLSLPKRKNERGRLVLGEESPPAKYRIPLSQTSATKWLHEGWIVDLDRIQFVGNAIPLDISLSAFAAFSLESDFALALPGDLVDAIYDYLGARSTEELDAGLINCEVRANLPNLTLTLGDQPITLEWWEYTGVWQDLFTGERFCVVEIQRMYYGDRESAMLGLPLLKKFDISFDMERNEIGCMLV
ncbi:aspartic proteinase precursor [Paraconiothyrium brasiliense]|uniref:Aspartic proteinase n=1 Tax=Paraconiothyrium brasiliense TaxID=300254 RepID=A0ABR3QQJ3_9PLEO